MINFINREIIIKNFIDSLLSIENIESQPLKDFLFKELISHDNVEIWNTNKEYKSFSNRMTISIFRTNDDEASIEVVIKRWGQVSYTKISFYEFKIFNNNKVKSIPKSATTSFNFFKDNHKFISQTSKRKISI